MRCVLLDSGAKKTRFCIEAAATLGLDNVEVVRARLAEHRPESGYAVVIARAFADPARFARDAIRLVDPGGALLAMTGRAPAAEEIPDGLGDVSVIALRIPRLGEPRHLVRVEPR